MSCHLWTSQSPERLPSGLAGAHNGAVTFGQAGAVCPQCGSAAAVHSIEELAAMARSRLGGQGYPAAPQQGYAAEPQQGPVPGYAAEPQQGPLPGYTGQPQQGPLPGYAGQPRSGPLPGGWRGSGSRLPSGSGGDDFSLEGDIADIALNAATRFIGRAISRRVQRAYSQVQPTIAAKQEEILRTQIAIAERHPDLRACMTDQVIFLAGGSRVLPMSSITGMPTVEQSDALVAKLRDG
jgi:hypothetical protein